MGGGKVLILGAGYAGLNAFYSIPKGTLIADSPYFTFYTAYLRNLLKPTPYQAPLPKGTIMGEIKDFDMKGRWVKLDGMKLEGDSMILALGCRRPKITQVLQELRNSSHPSLRAQYIYDEYIALQAVLYLRSRGLSAKYCGSPLSWLGKRVEEAVSNSLQEIGVKVSESCEKELPAPEPHELVGSFMRPKADLSVDRDTYVAGDLIEGPKLGELAMRTGAIAGANALGKGLALRPIFINILDFGKFGVHVRSNVPWGGSYQSVKKSPLRTLMKRFIERYYIWRIGKMGLLAKL
jgi:hypothetical protein